MADSENPKFRIEPLEKEKHDRAAFFCEEDPLNSYLKERARQETEKFIAAVYVLTWDGRTIAGYYTLSQYSVDSGELPGKIIRKLRIPKYDKLPATMLGRLARDIKFKGRGVGELLIMSALEKALVQSKQIASFGVVVDAKNEKARDFYLDYGFINLPRHEHAKLFLPMKTIQQLFPDA